ncbi:MAG: efflux RND transporter permease subunit [Pseudomonadota bacterium]
MGEARQNEEKGEATGALARIVDFFLRSDLTPFFIALSLIAGVVAIALTAREEEPQIVVPMADVLISAPGLPVGEVERQVATPLEKLLSQIDGVEHVYSQSLPGRAVVTVRFFVGEDREDSLVKIYNKIQSNLDVVPPDVASWVVKPVEIDDVPILIATLWSEDPARIDDHGLRRLAEEVEIELQAVRGTNRTSIFGGRPRVVRVELDADALAARRTAPLDVAWALGVSNTRLPAGAFAQRDTVFTVDAGDFYGGAEALRQAVVNVVDGTPVFLKDVARVIDGPAEPDTYSWIAFGAAEASAQAEAGRVFPAVHIAVAKRKGTNAVTVAARVKERLDELSQTHFPEGVHVRVTRDYGVTADNKVNELLEALLVAILIVVGLIAYSLGWREGLVVAAAVPITFALTLLVNYWAGYTINRVTLFALILSLGLVVDDPIVDVENIHRHLAMRKRSALDAVRAAVNEVRPPIILATLAVIVSFLPMMLITGMMGPYMQPMALNVPIAMLMSMVVAFTVTPWLAYRALKNTAGKGHGAATPASVEATLLHRFYARTLGPVLDDRRRAWWLLGIVTFLFLAAATLAVFRAVPLKMLPFDNKNELQILINPPEGTTLEATDALARDLAEVVRRAPEVRDIEAFVGMASPMDFNGMVRHYYLRKAPYVAELRINFIDKRKRGQQSHEIALRLRDALERVAAQAGARIAIVEVPPGPPVLATVTAEIYGAPGVPYERLREAARVLEARLALEPGAADIDSTVEDGAPRLLFMTDKEKAALSGVATEDIAKTVALALSGSDVARLHVPGEVNPLPIRLRLARAERSSIEDLNELTIKGRPGVAKQRAPGGVVDAPVPLIRLGELGRFVERPWEQAIYHKNLEPVAYVYAEAVGRAPAEIVADVASDLVPGRPGVATAARPRSLAARSYVANGGGIAWSLPQGIHIQWLGEGELNITRDVFRDLGIAFGVAVIGIYLLLVYQTGSYAMPWILMISIPLTMIGIMPGFWLLNALTGAPVAGHANPIFFTATAMIGMIALSGIAVRNAILLIEFLHNGLARGLSLRAAILEAGATRTRAILLTAGTAMLAAAPIAFDPVFSGLAWALIFGLLVSTGFTLYVVPVTYDLVYRNRPRHGLPRSTQREQSP